MQGGTWRLKLIHIEAFDVRGYVGWLTCYVSSPTTPALLVGTIRDGEGEQPSHLSVNLQDYGWYPVGLQIAVKEYDAGDSRIARALAAQGVLKDTGKKIAGPHGPGWVIYDLVPEMLKPGVVEAWKSHIESLATPVDAFSDVLAKAAFGRSVPKDGGTCVACGKTGLTRADFKDEISWREFNITKFCQKDQDSFYGDE